MATINKNTTTRTMTERKREIRNGGAFPLQRLIYCSNGYYIDSTTAAPSSLSSSSSSGNNNGEND